MGRVSPPRRKFCTRGQFVSTWGKITRSKKRSLASVATAAAQGDRGRALGLASSHLRSSSAKAHALRKVTDFEVARLGEALARARSMDLLEPQQKPVRWHYEEKSYGRYRMVCDLPVRVRVGQHMAKELIRAQWSPRSHIFDWPGHGGCQGAVAAIRDAVNNHGRYVVSADIRDCYPTFNPDYLYNTNMLPPEFVCAMLDSRQFRYRVTGDIPSSVDHTEQTRPRGLMQGGAASSTFIALALNDLREFLPEGVVPIIFSDNVILVCRSKVECEAAATALGRYLNDNPAGAFSPSLETAWLRRHCDDAQDLTAATMPRYFEQLGYSFALNDSGECTAYPSASNLVKAQERILEFIHRTSVGAAGGVTFEEALEDSLSGFVARSAETDEFVRAMLEPDYILASRATTAPRDPNAPHGFKIIKGIPVRIRLRKGETETPPWEVGL